MKRRDWLKAVSVAGLAGNAGWAVRTLAAAPAPDASTAPAATAASQALAGVVEGYFDDVLDLNPLQGTFLGEPKYANRLGNPSSEASIAAGMALDRQALRTARALDTVGLGSRFDVKAFHAEVLRDGSLPLDVLEVKLRRWVASQG
jgi:uncharacterized protein (DUF885 family)